MSIVRVSRSVWIGLLVCSWIINFLAKSKSRDVIGFEDSGGGGEDVAVVGVELWAEFDVADGDVADASDDDGRSILGLKGCFRPPFGVCRAFLRPAEGDTASKMLVNYIWR